jgi:hypothetical protein
MATPKEIKTNTKIECPGKYALNSSGKCGTKMYKSFHKM